MARGISGGRRTIKPNCYPVKCAICGRERPDRPSLDACKDVDEYLEKGAEWECKGRGWGALIRCDRLHSVWFCPDCFNWEYRVITESKKFR